MLRLWITDLKKHARGNPNKYNELYSFHADCYGIQYWKDRSFQDTRDSLQPALETTKKRLHTSRRKTLRNNLSEKVRLIESERELGRLKQLIKLVFHDKKKYCALDQVIKDGVTITADSDVAAACRNEFIPWFQAHPDDGSQISNNIQEWSVFEENAATFSQRFSNTNIPIEILLILHTSIYTNKTN
jgi:hypothetical protein